jgi:hypothetical protein
MAVWSVLGIPIGGVAGVLILIAVSVMGGGGTYGSGLPVILFAPLVGAVAGFLVGLAISLLRHVRKLRMASVAGSLAGVLLAIVTGGSAFVGILYGAVVGFLVGCVILPLWHPRTQAVFARGEQFLLVCLWPLWKRLTMLLRRLWKLITAARQSSKDPVEHSGENGAGSTAQAPGQLARLPMVMSDLKPGQRIRVTKKAGDETSLTKIEALDKNSDFDRSPQATPRTRPEGGPGRKDQGPAQGNDRPGREFAFGEPRT